MTWSAPKKIPQLVKKICMSKNIFFFLWAWKLFSWKVLKIIPVAVFGSRFASSKMISVYREKKKCFLKKSLVPSTKGFEINLMRKFHNWRITKKIFTLCSFHVFKIYSFFKSKSEITFWHCKKIDSVCCEER